MRPIDVFFASAIKCPNVVFSFWLRAYMEMLSDNTKQNDYLWNSCIANGNMTIFILHDKS